MSSAETSTRSSALSDRVSDQLLQEVVDRLGQYLLPGTSVALVAGSDDFLQQATFSSEWKRATDPDAVADAVVLLAAARSAEEIASLARGTLPTLHAEGMLALVLTNEPGAERSDVASVLWSQGFELVEWDVVTNGQPHAQLLFARPIRSGRGKPEAS